MIRSLRNRLLLGVILATTLIFLLASLTLYSLIRRSLLTEFDEGLLARAKALASLAEQQGGNVLIDLDAAQIPEFHSGPHPLYFILWNRQGELISASDSVTKSDFSTAFQSTERPVHWSWKRLPNHVPGREVVIQFTPHPEGQADLTTSPATSDAPDAFSHRITSGNSTLETAQLLVAAPAGQLKNQLTWFGILLAAVFTSTIIASAVVLYAVVQRGLKPLGVLANRIQTLGHQSLSERLAIADASTEMQPIVERLNELLANVETAFMRERAFTADVAHELRTPLAGLTTALEVAASRRRSPEEYEQIIAKCSVVAHSVRAMIANLLTLARADARQLHPANTQMNFTPIVRQTWQAFEPIAAKRQLRVLLQLDDPLSLNSDSGLLTIVLSNLFDNAVTYANEAGQMAIRAFAEGTTLVFIVQNTGSQVENADAEKVFQRFWRGDAARSANDRHAGLGLALCKRIITILGGTLDAKTEKGGDFQMKLTLPFNHSDL